MVRTKLKIIDKYPTHLTGSSLPTYEDIIRAIYQVKSEHASFFKPAIKIVVESVVSTWIRASLPIVSQKRITDRVISFHSRYGTLCRSDSTRASYVKKVSNFKVTSKQ